MAESLNVIALISGGKDSFFSILHCLKNGHKVIALGNLYPASPSPKPKIEVVAGEDAASEDDEHDLNSFMYQTVGHTVVPLYGKALGIPLYRQPIIGTAIQTGTSYSHTQTATAVNSASKLPGEVSSRGELEDETESLIPLLKRIIAEHPTANALSTGAILSTYQRTRIESVALRLDLTPLSYLWKYPILPPGIQVSLLHDMQEIGLDARIVKVASGGLDESFLWENVASEASVRRVERSMRKFGMDGDGAVLGEGGEFETLVIDGPSALFKGRIEIQEKDRKIVREGGGSSYLRIQDARVVMKSIEGEAKMNCRTLDLLEGSFRDLFHALDVESKFENPSFSKVSSPKSMSVFKTSNFETSQKGTIYWTISSPRTEVSSTISDEANQVISIIKQRLAENSLEPSNIISTIITLRFMADFAAVNKVYGSLFTQPNPPSRVTISCGSIMPKDTDLTIHLKVSTQPASPASRKALHVQSISYWAPANIGPYSQAISTPQSSPADQAPNVWTVDVAGQIALLPSSMTLPPIQDGAVHTPKGQDPRLENFKLQAVLSLQHLWRIGREMDISWWTSAVAYLPRGAEADVRKKARIASRAWVGMHTRDGGREEDEDDDEETRDLWEETHYAGRERRGGGSMEKLLPDWETLEVSEGLEGHFPPFFAVEVEELPRGGAVEWHAHLGIVGGVVKLNMIGEEDKWRVYQCAFPYMTQLIVAVSYSKVPEELRSRLAAAIDSLGGNSALQDLVHLSYLDESMNNIKEGLNFSGIIPCRSIWDVSARRLSAVLVLDVLA